MKIYGHWIVASLLATSGTLAAQESTEPFDGWKEYEEQLQAVLKTRYQQEKDFVTAVVDQVRRAALPKSLVDGSYLWVRNNRPNSNHPFVYFERVLRLRTSKLGISIPDFDASIYSSGGSRATGDGSSPSAAVSPSAPQPKRENRVTRIGKSWLRFFQRLF